MAITIKALKDRAFAARSWDLPDQAALDELMQEAPTLLLAFMTEKADVCAVAANALLYIMLDNEARTEAIFELGVEPIVASLDRHQGHEEACQGACRALVHLSDGPDGDRSAAMIAMGAVPLIVAVFRNYSGNTRTWAFHALEALGDIGNCE